MQTHKRAISWFAVIGAIAAGVHYFIAVGLEFTHLLTAVYANLAGFVFAFPVSYFGHRKFSFSNQLSSHWYAFPRFLFVALSGFFANQFLVINAMRYTNIPFWLTLGIVMVVVAIATYLLSRYWAFKGLH